MELLPNTFTTYALTPAEEIGATRFTELNRAYMQNWLALMAEELVMMEFDPLNPHEYARQKVYLDGKMAVLRFLLDVSSPAPVTTQPQE